MTLSPSLAPGMVIANRFRLDRLLGQGGMGSVWAAWHTTLNIEVAIKFIDPQMVSSRDAWSRFSQEAMAAAKIKSPHVVNVLDFGTDEAHRPYLAMELLQGEELASMLDREPTLPVGMVARIINHACKGLARAHGARIVHRDIKPDNLFLCEDDDGFLLKILDFGIAKVGSVGVTTHKTGTGQVLGTPLYMSPEQAYGNRPLDHRSDLYSLAVVAYRCLTGRVPFHSDGVGELIVAITTHPVPPPSRLRAGLPPGLDAWFNRALAKEPEKRFRNAKEMADAFAVACGMAPSAESTAQFSALNADLLGPPSSPPLSGPFAEPDIVPLVRRGSPSSPGSNPPSSRRQAVTLQGTTASFFESSPGGPGRRVGLIAGAIVGAALLGGGLFWYLSSREPTSTPLVAASAPAASSSAAASPTATAATTARPESSSPVVSVTSLPPEHLPRLPSGGLRPYGKVSPKAGSPTASPGSTAAPGSPTAAATAAAPATAPPTAAPTAAPATTKNDYGL